MSIPIKIYLKSRKCFYRKHCKQISRILWNINRVLFSCEIDPSADIHPDVITPHNLLGCVIGQDVIIGEGTRILHNVTIGGRKGIHAMPVIGKNVLIGCGAVILGDISIGDGAKVGSNAVVIDNVPPHVTVVGVPARIVGGVQTD